MKILDYFFRPIPGSPFNFYIPLLVAGILLIAFGIYMARKLHKEKDDRAFKKAFSAIPRTSIWLAASLLLNIGARYERFPLVGSRFVLYITLGFLGYYMAKYLKIYKKEYPKLQEQFRETPMQKRYTTKKY